MPLASSSLALSSVMGIYYKHIVLMVRNRFLYLSETACFAENKFVLKILQSLH